MRKNILKKKKKTKQETKQRRNAQSAIRYDMMMRDGICVYGDSKFSGSIEFSDINYVTEDDAHKNSLFNMMMELFNSAANEVDLEMTIVNKPLDKEEFQKSVFIDPKDDGLNDLRNEWNDVIANKLGNDSSKIETKRFLTYSVKEDNLNRARKSLDILQREIRNKLSRSLDCESHVCSGHERLESIYSILQPDKKFIFDYDQINSSMTTKDAICPDSFDFKESPYYFRTNDRYCKVFYLKKWSTELGDDLLYKLSDLEFNQVISLHMKAVKRGEDLSLVKTRIAKMEMEKIRFQQRAIDRGYDPEMLPQEFQYSYEEAKKLLDDVQQRNQRLFDCQLLLMLNASSEAELKEQEADIISIFNSNNCELGVLNFEQEDGMNGCLPIGNMYSGKTRLLTTAACSIFIPFVSKRAFHDTGLYYGLDSTTSNMIYIDRRKLANPSGWIFGKPGYGKSTASKRETHLVAIGTNDDIVVIDPEHEYGPLIERYGGAVVNISVNNNRHINPWAGDINDPDFMTSKMKFAQAYSATIMGSELTPKEKAIVDRTARKLYQSYIDRYSKEGKNAKLPTGLEYYQILKEQPEDEAKNMAIAHELYSTGTYNLFANESNVDEHNRIMCYGIRELDEVLRPLGMTVILESLWNRIISNYSEGKRTWIWIDEVYLMFKYGYSATFLYELFKRARKFGAVITGITQNVEDLLGNDKARSMLSNSEFVVMFRQSQSDAEELAELLNISNAQLDHVLKAPAGSGIISVSNSIITFQDEIDKNTEFYKLMTTNFDEVNQIRAAQ